MPADSASRQAAPAAGTLTPGEMQPGQAFVGGRRGARTAAAQGLSPLDLFGRVREGELDRIYFAHNGVELRRGADSRDWRSLTQ